MPPATNATGSTGDHEVRRHFEKLPAILSGPNKRGTRMKCKWCGEEASENVTLYQRPHILGCNAYKIEKERRKVTVNKQPSIRNAFKPLEDPRDLFAYAVYTSTANFSLFDTPEWKAFFNKVNFKLPNRNQLAGPLLKETYERIKPQVLEVAMAAEHIQIVSDASNTINKKKVENVSFLVDGISYYWSSTALGTAKAGAEWTLANVKKAALAITSGNLLRWKAYSSDTDNTQRKTKKLLEADQETAHVHWVPCQSHGIQLIFKDMLNPGKDQFKTQIKTKMGRFFSSGPNYVVSKFTASVLQLALLRDCMIRNMNGKVKALIATVPTRWGTQIAQTTSLIKSELSLRAYAKLPEASKKLSKILSADIWWQRLHALHSFLSPLHEHQKASESNQSTLPKVYPQWKAIHDHIKESSAPGGAFSDDIYDYFHRAGIGGWQDRMDKQLLPMHIVAFLLLPVNRSSWKDILPGQLERAETYIYDRLGTPGYNEWSNYLEQSGSLFNVTKPCWNHVDDPKMFWRRAVGF
jgi:hypothetical protein